MPDVSAGQYAYVHRHLHAQVRDAFPSIEHVSHETVFAWINVHYAQAVRNENDMTWSYMLASIAGSQDERGYHPTWGARALWSILESVRPRRIHHSDIPTAAIGAAFTWSSLWGCAIHKQPNILDAFHLLLADLLWSILCDHDAPPLRHGGIS